MMSVCHENQVCEEMGDYETVREDLEKMVPGASTAGQFAMSLVRREQEMATESNRYAALHFHKLQHADRLYSQTGSALLMYAHLLSAEQQPTNHHVLNIFCQFFPI